MPSLSTDGLLDLLPKKSSSNVSKAASAAFFAFSADVALPAAAVALEAAAVALLAALVALVAIPVPSIVASKLFPVASKPSNLPALADASFVISGVFNVVDLDTLIDLSNCSCNSCTKDIDLSNAPSTVSALKGSFSTKSKVCV